MDWIDQLARVLPKLKTQLQLTGFIVLIVGVVATRVVAPDQIHAQISAGAIGIVILVFAQIFRYLKDFPLEERVRLILVLFIAFIVFILALVGMTGYFISRSSHQSNLNTNSNQNSSPNPSASSPTIQGSLTTDPNSNGTISGVSRELAESYKTALEQFGSKEASIQLGGIYSLAKIANESKELHWPIIAIFTGYVRDNASWNPPANVQAIRDRVLSASGTTDQNFGERFCAEFAASYATVKPSAGVPTNIQAIITALGKRNTALENKGQRIDLRNSDLRGANLMQLNLDYAIFEGANLSKADAKSASLNGANFENAIVIETLFGGASLLGASFYSALGNDSNFYQAKLNNAFFMSTCLRNAEFGEAVLSKVRFKEADLANARIWDAKLDYASFEFANIDGVLFDGSSIKGTDFRGTVNIKIQQFSKANGDNATKFP
jgi:uncharacterized protein YjbI with pentapeptide repeats